MNEAQIKTGYTFRAPTLDDLEEVVALMNACAMKVIGQADDTVDDIRAEWQAPGRDIDADHRVMVSPDGRIVGYIQVMDHIRPMAPYVDTYVDPATWDADIADELMRWGEARARKALVNPKVPADARVVMQSATYANDPEYKAVLERAGMHISRIQWRMEIDLDGAPPAPEWPQGITVRPVAADEDLHPILQTVRDAWQDHWGYVEIPFDEHYERWVHDWQGEGHFDPSLWFVAMDGDQIAGVSLCKSSHAGDEELGWVQTLAVRREYRKHGLGMALLLHSFGELYRRGKRRVGLGVDAGSLTGATRLYQRAGMHVKVQIEVYEKELRPGIEYRAGAE